MKCTCDCHWYVFSTAEAVNRKENYIVDNGNKTEKNCSVTES